MLIGLLFNFVVFLSFSLVKLSVAGLPIRSILSVILFMALLISDQRHFISSLTSFRGALIVITLTALLGFVVSLLNGADLVLATISIMQIHLQSIVNLGIAAYLVRQRGPIYIFRVYLFWFSVTSLFAVAQFFDVSPAWTARSIISDLQGDDVTNSTYFSNARPMGLSFTPIVYATQLCLAFVLIIKLYSDKSNVRDVAVTIIVLGFIGLCVVTGNRSPIVGILVFCVIYWMTRGPVQMGVAIVGLAAIAVAIYFFPFEALESSSTVRVASVSDSSAQGRLALVYYGTLLFLSHWWGFGFGFDSTLYWSDLWSYVANMEAAETIISWPLHNYILNMLNVYGVLFVPIAIYAIRRLLRFRSTLLLFTPYMLHIVFHNDGPLWTDYMIWFLIPPIAIASMPELRGAQRAGAPATAIGHLPRRGRTLARAARRQAIPNPER